MTYHLAPLKDLSSFLYFSSSLKASLARELQLVNLAVFSGILKYRKITWLEALVRFVGVVSAVYSSRLANARNVTQ